MSEDHSTGSIRCHIGSCWLSPLAGVGRQTGVIGWRHVGNSAMDLALPSLATGAVDRVWYSVDGSSLYAKTASGRIFRNRRLRAMAIGDGS